MTRDYLEHVVAQRSPAWHQLRSGRVNGSTAKDVLAKIAKGEAAARRDLRVQLALETVLGTSCEDSTYVNADMQRGIDLEAEARAAYEMQTGHIVRECGYLSSITRQIGLSPDGVVGDFEGLVELKVPRSATHWSYLENGGTGLHQAQLTHALLVCHDVQWIDFVSYDPRFPAGLQLVVAHITRDMLKIDDYSVALDQFLTEVQSTANAITAKTKETV